jgi:hypothetical protein
LLAVSLEQEVCAFTCLSRVTSVSTSPEGLGIAVGDGSGTFYVRKPTLCLCVLSSCNRLTRTPALQVFNPVGLSSTTGDEVADKPKPKNKQKN